MKEANDQRKRGPSRHFLMAFVDQKVSQDMAAIRRKFGGDHG
jgi:hypothetical protein